MKNKRFILSFLAFVLVFASIVGGFMIAVDPLQFYHKAAYDPLFSREQRYQNPGLARNYEYDTIILGSSMTENFVPSKVEEALGGKVLKLSIEGSTSIEQRMIADVAFATGQVKTVVWGFDYFTLRDNNVRDAESFPFYLYNDTVIDDYKYVYNISNIKHAFGALLLPKDKYPQFRNIDQLNNWDKYAVYGSKKVLAKWIEAWNYEQSSAESEPDYELAKQRFDENVLSLIEAHPDVEFRIYYPPYSVIRQQVWYKLNPQRFYNQLDIKKYMLEKLQGMDNVKLYDFQSDESVTYNLDNFKDLSHHTGEINQWIIEQIAEGTHQITVENIDEFNSKLEQQAENLVINENGPIFSLTLTVEGRTASFAQIPTTSKDQVRVAVKDFAEGTDTAFTYDNDTKQATLQRGDNTLVLTADSPIASLNDEAVELDAPAVIVQGRLAGPLMQIVNLLGGDIEVTESEDTYFVNYDIQW